MDRPLQNSYWVVAGSLLAGEHPSDEVTEQTVIRLQRLLDAGIDSFVDLTQAGERPEYQGMMPADVKVVRVAIRDTSVPADIAEMRAIQAHLHSEIAAGRRVYVHCRAGIGRTGTVIGCYLVETGMDGPEALSQLNRLWRQSARSASWPDVPQTLEQADFIRHWTRYRRFQAEPAAVCLQRDLRERFLGSLLGLAVGDALSVTSHYRAAGRFAPIVEVSGGGVFELPAGHWTDDTALSLCLAESLLEAKGFDVADQMQRFGRWQSNAHLAAGTFCAGITPGTARGLHRALPHAPRAALAEASDNREPAPLSRIAPIVMFHYTRAIQAVSLAGASAGAFQATAAVQGGCRAMAAMLYSALHGEPLARILQPRPKLFGPDPLPPELVSLLDADPTRPPSKQQEAVIFVLAAARWALATSGGFRGGALKLANMGGDSDVIGSVHGQLAGAFYGQASIPSAWLGTLARHDQIEELAQRLYIAAQPTGG
jgi:ADP-ribosyl-[dinitrogen reductase] hydrolase